MVPWGFPVLSGGLQTMSRKDNENQSGKKNNSRAAESRRQVCKHLDMFCVSAKRWNKRKRLWHCRFIVKLKPDRKLDLLVWKILFFSCHTSYFWPCYNISNIAVLFTADFIRWSTQGLVTLFPTCSKWINWVWSTPLGFQVFLSVCVALHFYICGAPKLGAHSWCWVRQLCGIQNAGVRLWLGCG